MLDTTDIELKRKAIQTPLGVMVFTVSCTAERDGKEATGFTAIAHHPETGVMTLGSSGRAKGDEGYRLACANAARDLCFTVLAITKFRRMFEATRYAQ